MIDPKALDAAFGEITARLVAALAKGGVIAIDGKSLKGAYDRGENAQDDGVGLRGGSEAALATVAARDRNEVEAALGVIGLIDLKGKIVTVTRCTAIGAWWGRSSRGRRLLHRAQGRPGVAAVGCARLPRRGRQAEGARWGAADG